MERTLTELSNEETRAALTKDAETDPSTNLEEGTNGYDPFARECIVDWGDTPPLSAFAMALDDDDDEADSSDDDNDETNDIDKLD